MFSGLMLSQYTADTLIVEQRILYAAHNKIKALVKSCEILEEVEKVIGSLE